MTGRSDWEGRVGRSWADEWRRTDRSFGLLTDRLIEVADRETFKLALDIGCGAGETSLRLADARPDARVLGVDISEDLLSMARERVGDRANVEFRFADASKWTASGQDRPDLVLSRHGVMFFGQPEAAFAHIRSQAEEGCRLAFSCFRARSENEWAMKLAGVVSAEASPPSDPLAPGPFAFGDAEYVEQLLSSAGWRDVGLEAVDYPMIAGERVDAVEDALSYFLRIGPAAGAIAALDGEQRAAAIERLRELLAANFDGERVALPASSWIVTARA
ncbi:methyltransferase domain-containing protein [Qipengyuania gaetbuli]|uniref:class I SAM-dependent methyltransferase n=1 Tax=Qipengyuania gaetbuli TaxID=266952 RepID=UPI001C9993CA|nr:class I SAM-dependent methyltransferase [Qipengyuania gaetbuli]MBY6013472.1 methyltransferase domain-containing protein [Qipengyuania gaetbuli]